MYIGGDGYSYEHFDPILGQISSHFESIIRNLRIKTPLGKDVNIDLYLDATDPEVINAHAKRTSKENSTYEIRFSAGLSYHVWLSSRYILADYKFFNWLEKCKIKKKEIRKKGRKEFLADFSYFTCSYYIILHELAHIVLGHCDFINDEMGLDAWEEFNIDSASLTENDIKIRKAFEAEADRQAGVWLAAFFANALGPDSKGIDFVFPSKNEAYEFYIYSITAVFVLLQQLSQRICTIHPLPNQRQNIVSMAILQYFDKFEKYNRNQFVKQLITSMASAGNSLGLEGSRSAIEIAQNALEMVYVDQIVKETNIRRFQHIVVSIFEKNNG